ncbi:hypothetical protein [Amycolatopsis pretoriensis]|nr:hypothetical protein [Amycolatopsis pretoriensis]
MSGRYAVDGERNPPALPFWIVCLGWALIITSLIATGAGIGVVAERARTRNAGRHRRERAEPHAERTS